MNKRFDQTHLSNQRGQSTIIMTGTLAIIISILMASNILENSRFNFYKATQLETRKKVLDRTKNFLKSSLVVNHTFQNHSGPAQNLELAACIKSGTLASCNNIKIDFFAPTDSGSEKVIGSKASPVFADQYGQPCTRNTEGADNCFLQASTTCSFFCPNGQVQCAMVKVMRCDIEIAPIKEGLFKRLSLADKTSQFVASYVVRLTWDQKTIWAVTE